MTLSQVFFHQQTIFALFVYFISVIVAMALFSFVHIKSNHPILGYGWDKIGLPFIKTVLILTFILLVFPINFGIDSAQPISELLALNDKRSTFLLNMIFLLTFFFPLLPVIGKWEQLIIPLQGILASMIIFSWLCTSLNIEKYTLFPGGKTLLLILIISFITYKVAAYISVNLGNYLDALFHREGFQEFVFKGVVLIMQSPVIFIFCHSLGTQLS